MTKHNDGIKGEAIARLMFGVSVFLSVGDGSVALLKADYMTGILGIAAALAGAAGAIATSRTEKSRDNH